LINRRFKKISPYLDDLLANDWISSYTPGMVNTQFHIDHGNLPKKIAAAYADGKFPLNQKLPEGHEWLAIVFSDQQPYLKNENQLTMYLEYSKSVLVHAYSMMNMRDHGWTRYTEEELSFLSRFVFPNCRVLDVGCGTGRLTNGLARKGASVHGIDFSKKQLEIAEEAKVEDASFQLVDARKYSTRKKYDRVICMYDVVGSFPDEKDNLRILKKIYKNLKPGGIAVLSVMNMELTRKNCQIKKNVVPDIYGSIDRLLRLNGSNTMQSTGDVFNGEFIIIDDSTGLCYRKEQFFSENYLPLEYLIRDRRYTKQEISRLVQKVGFDVEECYCFRAGFLEDELKSTDPHAKEILVVARKPNKGKFFH